MTDFTQYDILKLAHQKADKKLLDLKEYIEGLELQASVNQAKISQLSTDITRLNAEALDASKGSDELNSLYNVEIRY